MPAGTWSEKRMARRRRSSESGRSTRQIGRPKPSWDERLQGGKIAAREPLPGPELARVHLNGARGCSSDGRALQSHCRGQGFDSPQLHQPPALKTNDFLDQAAHDSSSCVSQAYRKCALVCFVSSAKKAVTLCNRTAASAHVRCPRSLSVS